jgi:hypothetical protein
MIEHDVRGENKDDEPGPGQIDFCPVGAEQQQIRGGDDQDPSEQHDGVALVDDDVGL